MKVLIVGMGKSGRGVARFLLSQGYDVVGYDQQEFKIEGVRPFILGEAYDLIVLSPGVPQSPIAGEVIGEAELAFRYMKNRCVGITGTNGKTTLTLLITHVLNNAGVSNAFPFLPFIM